MEMWAGFAWHQQLDGRPEEQSKIPYYQFMILELRFHIVTRHMSVRRERLILLRRTSINGAALENSYVISRANPPRPVWNGILCHLIWCGRMYSPPLSMLREYDRIYHWNDIVFEYVDDGVV